MKFKYLGTAAAEGFPAIFCRCKYCVRARELGGKNIRTRSQAMVNDDLLIDYPADSYSHFLSHGIEADKIKTLIITHAHSDHLYPSDLFMRGSYYAHNMLTPELDIVCSSGTYDVIGAKPHSVNITLIKPYETLEINGYKITAIPALHNSVKDPLFFVIEGEKNILYAHDTGYFSDEIFGFIERRGFKFDMVSIDCTNVDLPVSENEGHMGFVNIPSLVEKLKVIGAIGESTLCYVNHFSHNGNPLHDHLCERAASYGMSVAYDGCEIEL